MKTDTTPSTGTISRYRHFFGSLSSPLVKVIASIRVVTGVKNTPMLETASQTNRATMSLSSTSRIAMTAACQITSDSDMAANSQWISRRLPVNRL